MAKWPSGKAEACKAFTPGSNPGFASIASSRGSRCFGCPVFVRGAGGKGAGWVAWVQAGRRGLAVVRRKGFEIPMAGARMVGVPMMRVKLLRSRRFDSKVLGSRRFRPEEAKGPEIPAVSGDQNCRDRRTFGKSAGRRLAGFPYPLRFHAKPPGSQDLCIAELPNRRDLQTCLVRPPTRPGRCGLWGRMPSRWGWHGDDERGEDIDKPRPVRPRPSRRAIRFARARFPLARGHRFAYITSSQADMAQLVEHHLAKVGVAGSSPVVRSIEVTSPGSPWDRGFLPPRAGARTRWGRELSERVSVRLRAREGARRPKPWAPQAHRSPVVRSIEVAGPGPIWDRGFLPSRAAVRLRIPARPTQHLGRRCRSTTARRCPLRFHGIARAARAVSADGSAGHESASRRHLSPVKPHRSHCNYADLQKHNI